VERSGVDAEEWTPVEQHGVLAHQDGLDALVARGRRFADPLG